METDKVNCKFIEDRKVSFLLENEHGKRASFPKSQVYFDRRNLNTGECIAVIPIWLLDKKAF